jgi:2-polyprenyl-6-methoxyphenol hydroxylase-like FAD-dependent oxidoreductase
MSVHISSPVLSSDLFQPRTAVVIGASLAGMLAAHVMARRFDRVVLLERGEAVVGTEPRRNVPQERHVHMLLQRGKNVLDAMIPGFVEELERHGAVVADASGDVQVYHRDRWKRQFKTGIHTHYCTRGLIDHVIRERLRESPKVEFLSNTRVTGLVRSETKLAIVGVNAIVDGQPQQVMGDLVIDASGRGSQASRWLEELGCAPVRVSEVTSKLGYGTRVYQRRPEYEQEWKAMMVMPTAPGARRMGVVSPVEGNRWMVTTGGWLGECPGTSEGEFLDFLKSLPDPAIYEVIRDAVPLSEVSIYRMPGGMRRHYEELANWPGRFFAIGDAMCSLNPIYGQGMTVSALEVEELGRGLDALIKGGATADGTRALQRRIATHVDVPWGMAEAEDLRFPEVEGERGWKVRLQQRYGAMVAEASSVDEVVCKRLLEVINLVEPPTRLMAPMFQARVLTTAARLRLARGRRADGARTAR